MPFRESVGEYRHLHGSCGGSPLYESGRGGGGFPCESGRESLFFDYLILYLEDDGFRPWPNLPPGPR